MYGDVVTTSVAKVVGANARTIRLNGGITLDRFSRALRWYGLRWSTGRVGSFEAGHVPAKIEILYTVALALTIRRDNPVTLADLLAGDGEVSINDELSVPLSVLRDAVSGKPVTVGETEASQQLGKVLQDAAGAAYARSHPEEVGQLATLFSEVTRERVVPALLAEFGEADMRVCKKLGVDREAAAFAMFKLWGHTFSHQRDRVAGPDANAQHRGNVSRQLQAELQEALADGND
jgi:hypothetical protein